MPSFESQGNTKHPMMIPAGTFEDGSVSYIDLDLPPPSEGLMDSPNPHIGHNFVDSSSVSNAGSSINGRKMSSNSAVTTLSDTAGNPNHTAYKKIDFVKTEAFNRTRNTVEQKYNQEQN